MKAFNKYAYEYNYDFCEDSTRVFTIKVKDIANSRIIHSCDFAIVNNYEENQQYIRFNKKSNTYNWAQQSSGFYLLPEKINFCKENSLWQEVRDTYIEKKNNNTDSRFYIFTQ